MTNKNVYNIPVDLTKSQVFKIEGINQRDAIDQLTRFLKNHKETNDMFTGFKVRETEIDCNQDGEIIDNVIKDFMLKVKTEDGVEYATHNVAIDTIWPGFENNEPGVQTLSSFCGADFVFAVDNKIHGIFQGVKFDTSKNLELNAELAIFSNMDESYESLRNAKDVSMIQIFANEYGIRMVKDYHKVTFIGEEYNPTVDTIVDTVTYKFKMSEAPGNFKTVSDEEWEKLYAPILDNSKKI